jgi:predicted aconitase
MTKPFDANDRSAILAALAEPNPPDEASRAIVEAIATRVKALTDVLSKVSTEHGAPDAIEIAKPQTALDEVVVALFRQAMREPGAPPVIVHQHGKQ